jgi:hypothetical protein
MCGFFDRSGGPVTYRPVDIVVDKRDICGRSVDFCCTIVSIIGGKKIRRKEYGRGWKDRLRRFLLVKLCRAFG